MPEVSRGWRDLAEADRALRVADIDQAVESLRPFDMYGARTLGQPRLPNPILAHLPAPEHVTRYISGILANNKVGLLHSLEHQARRSPRSLWPLHITMPCDESIEFQIGAEISSKSMPCTCGDEAHWFIKYTEEETNESL